MRNDCDKTDSSGKQLIDYFRKENSKNKIFLIGFDFHREQKCIAHNFIKEREKILEYDNVIVL
jgi:predicted aldo/keto reductase-like oxidoreductase